MDVTAYLRSSKFGDFQLGITLFCDYRDDNFKCSFVVLLQHFQATLKNFKRPKYFIKYNLKKTHSHNLIKKFNFIYAKNGPNVAEHFFDWHFSEGFAELYNSPPLLAIFKF